ncbi:MAG: hypothetical protein NTW86_30570, partial [Candidatus Sumerlaeota bacterium]|nr:hypothetical protein [Candidatus Sumerlaeota bacterium]
MNHPTDYAAQSPPASPARLPWRIISTGAMLLVGLLPQLSFPAATDADYQPQGRYLRQVFSTNQFKGDLVYSPGVDFVKRDKTTVKIDLKLNIFLPPEEDTNPRRPVIIHVHGGGWNGDTMDTGKGTEKLEMG